MGLCLWLEYGLRLWWIAGVIDMMIGFLARLMYRILYEVVSFGICSL